MWTVGRTCLMPNCLFTGGHFEWRVPIDDENMLSVGWFFDRVPNEMEPFTQDRIPTGTAHYRGAHGALDHHACNEPGLRRLGRSGCSLRSTQEHLGESDRGVIMMRSDAGTGRACGPRRRAQGGDSAIQRRTPACTPDHRPGVFCRRLLPSEQRQTARAHAGTRPTQGLPLLDRPAGGNPAGLPPRDGIRHRSQLRVRSLVLLSSGGAFALRDFATRDIIASALRCKIFARVSRRSRLPQEKSQ